MYVLRNYSADQLLDRLLTVILFFTAGLALSRLLYEGLFPHFLWLGHPLSAFLLAAIVTIASWVIWSAFWWRGEGSRHSHAGSTATMPFTSTAIFLPLILNLFYLIDPVVDLETSRFLFAASLWLSAVFLARQLARPDQWPWLGALFLWAGLFPLYLLTMPAVAGRADTFEFQVVIPQLGIAHPTGYPLYILLGRLFAALPFGSVAWRINLASAVFATLAATMLYLAGRRLWKEKLAALLAAVLFGLTPTLWSQAVQAEVYALHALFVAGALYLMALMLDHGAGGELCAPGSNWQRPIWLLAFIIGLGLTNHLTTIILLPAAVLAVLLAYWGCFRAQDWKANSALLLKVALAYLLPLFIYVYLPLRWWALHEEPMGLAQFVDWVIGDRFQGALQLTAWLNDLTRYEIVWLLLLAEWGWINLLIAFLGLIYAAYRNWRSALVLLLVLAGYIFYALNYHVPDLAVFLIPAHAVIALFWGAAIAAVLALLVTLFQRRGWAVWTTPLSAALILLLALPALIRTVKNWPDTDYAGLVALQTWGEGVLALPLERNAAILADSEKIAPLYYLQQAEGLRPDLDILVLPDEAAYRAELDARIAAGQTVYLARFLPGLEGLYHLRSQGPLLEVSLDSLQELPTTAMPSDLKFDALRLLGYQIEEPALVDSEATAVTFYWQLEEPVVEPEFIYVRWAGRNFEGSPATSEGTHPAGNYYPTVAFRPGEIVADYHLFPKPFSGGPLLLDFQVAAGPQFAAAEDLTWQTVSRVEVGPAEAVAQAKEYRAQNGRMLLSQASFPDEIRPGTPLPVIVGGYAALADLLEFELLPLGQSFDRAPRPGTLVIDQTPKPPIAYMAEVNTDLANGRYQLLSRDPLAASFCGWLASPTSGCVLGEVAISGVPLPEDAANFDDKIVLLDIDLPGEPLISGGVLPVKLTWQGLADMTEDYTVFLQVLDDQDQIVGQVDAWPLQGTYPTGQWPPGEIVEDPYEIHLAGDLPPGNYRLQVGLYLLATLRRLPLLDAQGQPMDDKVVISGLVAE